MAWHLQGCLWKHICQCNVLVVNRRLDCHHFS